MKNAEEWNKEKPLGICDEEFTNFIKQIQLDAWKQGMEDARARIEFVRKNTRSTSEGMLLNYLFVDIEIDMKEEQSFNK